ncbi:MAG: hypothetical protein JO189_08840, partial [Deltaproteobacteria bacterium]|nr:hypothetical protein [Deltaproteobacteria bacterium]
MIREIQLRYQDPTGTERVLRLAGEVRNQQDGIALAAQTEPIAGGRITYTRVENLGDRPHRLGWLGFELDTGLDAAAPARFFKHGYQSWSAS